MGYVAAFRKGDMFPPVAIVVTETLLEVLLFPFVKDNQRLLTAAHISVNLWKEDVPTLVEPNNCLRLLACLFYAGFKQYSIQYDAAEDHEEMRKIVAISKDKEIERITAEKAEIAAAYEAKNTAYEAEKAKKAEYEAEKAKENRVRSRDSKESRVRSRESRVRSRESKESRVYTKQRIQRTKQRKQRKQSTKQRKQRKQSIYEAKNTAYEAEKAKKAEYIRSKGKRVGARTGSSQKIAGHYHPLV